MYMCVRVFMCVWGGCGKDRQGGVSICLHVSVYGLHSLKISSF